MKSVDSKTEGQGKQQTKFHQGNVGLTEQAMFLDLSLPHRKEVRMPPGLETPQPRERWTADASTGRITMKGSKA